MFGKIIFAILFVSTWLFSNPLQDAINKAKPYSVIKLSKGIYKGHIVIDKPITIIGKNGKTIITGSGKGTVITIKSSNVTLKNLTIIGSGNRRDNFDGAITADKVKHLTIEYCTIKDSLYGIHLAMADNCLIENNRISSKNEKIPQRGDGLKLWYSNHNIIRNNLFQKIRDVSLARSNFNIIENNRFFSSRFATYLEFGKNNIIKNNLYKYNEVSVMLMGTKNIKVLSNKILGSQGAVGIGVVIKGGRNILFSKNLIKFNAQGFFMDYKYTGKNIQRTITDNEISYNLEALHFHAIISNNSITHNKIFNNLVDVAKDLIGDKNKNNIIEYNYWGNYVGFDRNGDNIGDTPYVIYRYTDQLWQYDPKIKFFFGSVAISLINFLCEIAPFTEPKILFEDKKPLLFIKK